MRSPLPLSITSISRKPLYPTQQRVEIDVTQPWCFSKGLPRRQSLQISDANQSPHLDWARPVVQTPKPQLCQPREGERHRARPAHQPAQIRREESRAWIYSLGLWHWLTRLCCFQHFGILLHTCIFILKLFTSFNSSRCRNFQSCLGPEMRMSFSVGIKKPSCSCFVFKFSFVALKSEPRRPHVLENRLQSAVLLGTDPSWG